MHRHLEMPSKWCIGSRVDQRRKPPIEVRRVVALVRLDATGVGAAGVVEIGGQACHQFRRAFSRFEVGAVNILDLG